MGMFSCMKQPRFVCILCYQNTPGGSLKARKCAGCVSFTRKTFGNYLKTCLSYICFRAVDLPLGTLSLHRRISWQVAVDQWDSFKLLAGLWILHTQDKQIWRRETRSEAPERYYRSAAPEGTFWGPWLVCRPESEVFHSCWIVRVLSALVTQVVFIPEPCLQRSLTNILCSFSSGSVNVPKQPYWRGPT